MYPSGLDPSGFGRQRPGAALPFAQGIFGNRLGSGVPGED